MEEVITGFGLERLVDAYWGKKEEMNEKRVPIGSQESGAFVSSTIA